MIEPNINSKQQRQHFVPRSYLKRFAKAKDKVSAVDLVLDNKAFLVGFDSICIEKGINDLSSFVKNSKTDIPADLTEQLYSVIEGEYNTHMRNSLDQGKLPITDASYQAFGLFVIHQLCRTPWFRSSMKSGMGKHFTNNAEFSTVSFISTVKLLVQHKVLDNALFTLFRATGKNKFITSDNPATAWLNDRDFWTVFYPPYVSDFWSKKLKFVCPLSPEYLLTIDPYNSYIREYTYHELNDNLVESFNDRTKLTASRFLIV